MDGREHKIWKDRSLFHLQQSSTVRQWWFWDSGIGGLWFRWCLITISTHNHNHKRLNWTINLSMPPQKNFPSCKNATAIYQTLYNLCRVILSSMFNFSHINIITYELCTQERFIVRNPLLLRYINSIIVRDMALIWLNHDLLINQSINEQMITVEKDKYEK